MFVFQLWSLVSNFPWFVWFFSTNSPDTDKRGVDTFSDLAFEKKLCQEQTLQSWGTVLLFSCISENQIIPCCYFVKLFTWLPQITHKNKLWRYIFMCLLSQVTRKYITASSKHKQMCVDRTYRALTELLSNSSV